MNFDKAEDREHHHLLTMERKLDSLFYAARDS